MSLLLGSSSKLTFLTREVYKVSQNSPRPSFIRTYTTSGRQLSPDPFSGPTAALNPDKAKSIWPSPRYDSFNMGIATFFFLKLTTIHRHQRTHLERNIYVAHRPPTDWADWTALKMVRLLRRGTDFATGYKHHVASPAMADDETPQLKTKTHGMTEQKWLTRFVFLESVAGVPGMVAGMLRHLHSLRRLKKDNGW
jgi:hypothetical protein